VNTRHIVIIKQDSNFTLVPISELYIFKEKFQTSDESEELHKRRENEIINAMKGGVKRSLVMGEELEQSE
jgi:hypothetical protein